MKRSIRPYSLLLAVMATVGWYACEKDNDIPHEEDVHTSHTGTVSLSLDHKVGEADFQYHTDYTDGFGNVYQIQRVQYYISGIAFTNDAGATVVALNDTYFLVDPMVDSLDLKEFTPGHLHEVQFNIGVDSATNGTDPTAQSADHPLAPQNPSMHWSWASGYKFLVMEGEVDTDADGTVDTPFGYHIGSNRLLRSSGAIHVHRNIEENTHTTVMINVDYGALLNGVDIRNNLSTHTANNLPLATQIADNIDAAFGH